MYQPLPLNCSAGAEIIGPFASEKAALGAIHESSLCAAVTDLNLGFGPSFEAARALRLASVPFIFLTGYDQSSIPEEFADVPRLIKPFDARNVVRELARMLGRS